MIDTSFDIIKDGNDVAFDLYCAASPEEAEVFEGALGKFKTYITLLDYKNEVGKDQFYTDFGGKLPTTLLVDFDSVVDAQAGRVWGMARRINKRSKDAGTGYIIPVVDTSCGLVQVMRSLFEF